MASSLIKSLALSLAVSAGSLGIALSAAAESPAQDTKVSVEVSLADLNLETEAGAQAAFGRIKSAARKVCRDAAPRSLLKPRAAQECERATVNGALADLASAGTMLASLEGAVSE